MCLNDGLGPVFAILAVLSILTGPHPSIWPGSAAISGRTSERDLASAVVPVPGSLIGAIQ